MEIEQVQPAPQPLVDKEPRLGTQRTASLRGGKAKAYKGERVVLLIRGEWFDCTEFIHRHPGGPAALLPWNGRDATEAFERVHAGMFLAENAERRLKPLPRVEPLPLAAEPAADPDFAFLFEPISSEQQRQLWSPLMATSGLIYGLILGYAALLGFGIVDFYPSIYIFGAMLIWSELQQAFMNHDALHSAPNPPGMLIGSLVAARFDVYNLCWTDTGREHTAHHYATQELTKTGGQGWDPIGDVLFALQKNYITWPLLPVVHFLGGNDNGWLAALCWFYHTRDQPTERSQVQERRIHRFVQTSVWLGFALLGFAIGQGWRFVVALYIIERIAAVAIYVPFHNVLHSSLWEQLPMRLESWPCTEAVLCFMLGGKSKWNALRFHDMHHAFVWTMGDPNARSRLFGADRVEMACKRIINEGIFNEQAGI